MQILFQFDVRTVALFVALTFLVQATAIGAQAYMIRDLKQYRGIGLALTANLSVAAGIILRLFMDWLPGVLDTILASTLVLLGPGLFYVALSQFTGLSYSRIWVVGILAISQILMILFSYPASNVRLGMTIFSIAAVLMVITLIYQLWRMRKTSLQLSADLMLVPFLIYGAFMIIRTGLIMLGPPQTTFSNSPVQSATFLLLYAISFIWSTGFILMVSQRLTNDLMEVATTDVLTRIPNRRATQAFLDKELSRVQRHQGEFSVLLIDIDKFKQVNDKWGHAVGDHVLVETANKFQTMIRKQDWVGRWGGEEFLMILPGPPDCNAQVLAERLRSEIAALKYRHGVVSLGITISIGVTCGTQTDQVDQILKRADHALYKAKRTRNTVSVDDG